MLTDALDSREPLVAQAKRLRFLDPAIEEDFRIERLQASVLRTRVMVAMALVIVLLNGLWLERVFLRHKSTEAYAQCLFIRLVVIAPAFLMAGLSTWPRMLPRRAAFLCVSGITLACIGSALLSVFAATKNFPNSGDILGNVLPILVISVIALPLGLRGSAWMIGLTSLGIIPWYAGLYHAESSGVSALCSGLLGMGSAIVFIAWWKERGERTLFAQREDIRRIAGELSRVNAEQAAFMGIAAHDLRAPLATVRGYAELLRKGKIPAGDSSQRAVEEIERQSTRMLGLLTDYLGAHAAAGKAKQVQIARVNLRRCAEQALDRHGPTAAAKGQSITLSPESISTDVWAHADEANLAQVVDNFVINALKFSPAGSAVTLELSREGGRARLCIADQGPGVPEAERPELFRMFGRGSARPTNGEASHGFGLAVAKRLAESMGGSVGCQNRHNLPTHEGGARFWVELPSES